MKLDTGVPDHVKIASFIFLDEYRSKNHDDPSGIVYNKFMTLLNSELKKDKIDIRLPHCWYRWGDEVVRYHMPYLYWNHDDPRYTTVLWKGKTPRYNVNDPTVSEIKSFSGKFIDLYSGPEGAEMAIDKVYEKAPFKFQNEYRKIRESLKITKSKIPPDNYIGSVLMPLFENAMRVFPKEFSSVKGTKEDFEEVFKMAAERGGTIQELFEMAEDFWFFFCYHLRLNKKCHENVPISTLDIWEEMISWETEMYERGLQNNVREFYDGCPENPVADRLLENWKKDTDEFERLLNKYPDNLDELLYGKDR
ncbi:MAG: hypothetical protein FWD37_01680 [Methanomassiliicoccaceae archaeon]|nr:hypothetical protein [Methanomassiliicoccaceae archaeon]